MSIVKEGNYTKYLSFEEGDILTFIAKTESDKYHEVLESIRNNKENYNGFQCCEIKEEYNNFTTILFNRYDLYGNIKESKYIHFDFENNKIISNNGRSYKVKDDKEFSYKLQKTQIKANNGIKGFYDLVIKSMHMNSPIHGLIYGVIEKLDSQHEKVN